MRLCGEQLIAISPQRFWELLFHPSHLESAIPGATVIQRESKQEFTGTIERSLSGIAIGMDISVDLIEDSRPSMVTYRFSGVDTGTNSELSGTVEIVVSSTDDDHCRVNYEFDWSLTGRLSILGSRMTKRQLQHDMSVFLESFGEPIDRRTPTE